MFYCALSALLVAMVSGSYINLVEDGGKTFDTFDDLKADINAPLEKEIAALEESISAANRSSDIIWMIICAAIVFLMQSGFALLEVGSVSMKNTKNILVKNMLDACIGCITFYLIGYAFAFGGDNKFIGVRNFALNRMHGRQEGSDVMFDGYSYAFWMFQFAFAATAATIVSGAVAERCQVTAYFFYSFALTGFVYPVVVHWAWSDYGWASAFLENSDDLLFGVGVIDFAGSAVVHMVGGTTALIGAILLGPRRGRFGKHKFHKVQQSATFQTLGVFILWFGWYGFNCGSTLGMMGASADVAGSVACTTTIAAASGGIIATCIGRIWDGSFSIQRANNGILAGLVSITAGCAVVTPEVSLAIGIIGGFVYFSASEMLIKLRVDDVVDASPVHLFCGIWGTLAAGIFAHPDYVASAYGSGSCGLFYECGGLGPKQFAANLVFVLSVVGWCTLFAFLIFGFLKLIGRLRVDIETERVGLDQVEHGGHAYEMQSPQHDKSAWYRKDNSPQTITSGTIVVNPANKHQHNGANGHRQDN